MRTIHFDADQVNALRSKLQLTQAGMAKLLHVSRRTIVRAEQRGMEAPWFSDTLRYWCLLQTLAWSCDTYSQIARSAIAFRLAIA
jgi:DNA-binding XRE family transcriptional regulator